MVKKSLICAAAFAFVFSVTVISGIGTAVAKDTGPEVITLKTQKGKKPALFPHKKHQDMMDCSKCHHTKDADGKQVAYSEGMKIQKCETCHDGSMANKKISTFKNAAHTRCKGCHKAGFNGKKGPTKCSGCHVKKK